MDYSKYALESAVLTLLPQAQANRDSTDLANLFPLVTEKFFLLDGEPEPVDIACYKIVKSAITDINNHGFINYGKTEFAHEVCKQAKIHLMKSNLIPSVNKTFQEKELSGHPHFDSPDATHLEYDSSYEQLPFHEHQEQDHTPV